MTTEEIERALASVYAHTFVSDLILECMLTTHPEPSGLLALIEKRVADKRATTGLELLRVGDREEQCLSDAMDLSWDRWLSIARHHLRA